MPSVMGNSGRTMKTPHGPWRLQAYLPNQCISALHGQEVKFQSVAGACTHTSDNHELALMMAHSTV